VPGFSDACALATFPLLANWVIADFALASLRDCCSRVRFVVDHDAKTLALALAGRWKNRPAEVHVLEGGLAGLLRLLASDEAEQVLVGSLSAAWTLGPAAPSALAAAAGASVAKASLNRTPVELYGCRRDRLIAVLESAGPRLAKARRSRELLFDGTLTGAIEVIEEVPGELLFLNDPTDLHRRTLALAVHDPALIGALPRMPEMAEAPLEARIGERARVVSSWIAPGADIEGTVEGSVIFPGASVRRAAHVANSVLMNGAIVGSGATVHNALVLPHGTADPAGRPGARATPTIGDRCSVGSRSSTAVNAAHPDQIRDGLTVIGMGVDLPNGFRVEAGCLVGPGASPAELRRQKVLRRGQSVPEDRG
jgi:carbonic anhydrase/acetyltransferase-like protein (isoleucine patch superfamily)